LVIFRQEKSRVSGHTKYALKCHFSPDNKCFATTGADGFVRLWDTANTSMPMNSIDVTSDMHRTTHSDRMEQKWIWDCAFTCDAKYLFTASGYQLRLWNLETGEVVRRYQGHNKMITCFTFSDGGIRKTVRQNVVNGECA
uniref:Target of rapamycin complex subunit lst8 n=1 Tax=Gongylonema pulchrum TaxID=637853 RepID=A0A183DN24_9BILA